MHIFALNATHALGAQVVQSLGVLLSASAHEERGFEEGERKIGVRGHCAA